MCCPILKKFDSTTASQLNVLNLSILGSDLLTAYTRAECIHEISCKMCGYDFRSSSVFNDKSVFLLGIIFLLYDILPLACFFSLFLSCFCFLRQGSISAKWFPALRVVKDTLELLNFLSPPPRCWDHRPLCLALTCLFSINHLT